MIKSVWRYGVIVDGVKKRQRIKKTHVEGGSKGLYESEAPDNDLAVKLASEWIAQNMKSVSKAYAKIYRWEIDGEIERWHPCNDADNIKIQLPI